MGVQIGDYVELTIRKRDGDPRPESGVVQNVDGAIALVAFGPGVPAWVRQSLLTVVPAPAEIAERVRAVRQANGLPVEPVVE